MAVRPDSRQGLQAISMVIQPSTTAAMAITAVTTAPIRYAAIAMAQRFVGVEVADLEVGGLRRSQAGDASMRCR